MKPIVSIIVPVYNHEKFIADCIESALLQTFQNWEMIIIDDCSIDRTQAVITKYLKDPRIRYIRHCENYGKEKLFLTHNEALAMCKGEFITILEGDDYWPKQRLEKQLKSFYNTQIVLSHGDIAIDSHRHITIYKNSKNIKREVLINNPTGAALKYFLYGKIPIIAQSVMVRKSVMNKIGGFKQIPNLYLVDYPTWMEIALYGKFAFIPEVLGYWRRHSDSITSMYQQQLWQGTLDYIDQFVQKHKDELNRLPVNLDHYMKYPGAYALSALYKVSLLNGNRMKARNYLYEIWRKRKGCELKELLKVCLLSPFVFVPYLFFFYKKYIAIKTRKFAPH